MNAIFIIAQVEDFSWIGKSETNDYWFDCSEEDVMDLFFYN